MQWTLVYDFAADLRRTEAMQKATLGRTDFGVSAEPALVGTSEWWGAIERGVLPHHVIEGTISDVYWGSMGDWPEFRIVDADGAESTWTREGDHSRYVKGLRVRLSYTSQRWKVVRRKLGLGSDSKIVLRIEIEESDRRSDPRAPGPGGAGLVDPRVRAGDVDWRTPWFPVEGQVAAALEQELTRELRVGHPLHGKVLHVVGRRQDRDDVLVDLPTLGRCAVVHLTWTSHHPSAIPLTRSRRSSTVSIAGRARPCSTTTANSRGRAAPTTPGRRGSTGSGASPCACQTMWIQSRA